MMRRRVLLAVCLAAAAGLVVVGVASSAASQPARLVAAADPCLDRYPSGTVADSKFLGGRRRVFDRQASLYQVCEGFGAPDTAGFTLTPAQKCALIAAAAVYGGPAVNLPVSHVCTAVDLVGQLRSGNWAGAVKGVGCGYFSDIFATSAGVFVAGATAETGPGAVAIGVNTYKALLAGLKLACGGLLTAVPSQLGVKLEARHETAVALDVTRKGRCLHETDKFAVGIQWSAVACAAIPVHGGSGTVTATTVGPLRLGQLDEAALRAWAGPPDQVWQADPTGAWLTFPNDPASSGYARVTAGTAWGYRCNAPAPHGFQCLDFYAFSADGRLNGFLTTNPRFQTAHGSHVGSTVATAVANERLPTSQVHLTGVQCPGLNMTGQSSSTTFVLYARYVGGRPTLVDTLYLTLPGSGLGSGCD